MATVPSLCCPPAGFAFEYMSSKRKRTMRAQAARLEQAARALLAPDRLYACFYCEKRFHGRDEKFVMCDTCEGYTACLACWASEGNKKGWSQRRLEERKDVLLAKDCRHPGEGGMVWQLLAYHEFCPSHADMDSEDPEFSVWTRNLLKESAKLEAEAKQAKQEAKQREAEKEKKRKAARAAIFEQGRRIEHYIREDKPSDHTQWPANAPPLFVYSTVGGRRVRRWSPAAKSCADLMFSEARLKTPAAPPTWAQFIACFPVLAGMESDANEPVAVAASEGEAAVAALADDEERKSADDDSSSDSSSDSSDSGGSDDSGESGSSSGSSSDSGESGSSSEEEQADSSVAARPSVFADAAKRYADRKASLIVAPAAASVAAQPLAARPIAISAPVKRSAASDPAPKKKQRVNENQPPALTRPSPANSSAMHKQPVVEMSSSDESSDSEADF